MAACASALAQQDKEIKAALTERGELKLEDSILLHLPETVKAPDKEGRRITLLDLATHTSGLPRDADDLDSSSGNAFAAYGPAQLYAFLSRHRLSRAPGEGFEYSNVGAMLLGHILSRRAGVPYEQLDRTAMGHDGGLDAMPLWPIDGIVGTGSIRSTAEDMLRFVGAQLGLFDHPLKEAMAAMLRISRPGAAPSVQQHHRLG